MSLSPMLHAPSDSSATSLILDDAGERRNAAQSIAQQFTALSIDGLPDNTRAIVSPRSLLEEAVDSYQSSVVARIFQQSSNDEGFELDFKGHRCRFFYDPGSDEVVLQNLSAETIHVKAANPDAVVDSNTTLRTLDVFCMKPGVWRISSTNECLVLADLVLLERRYTSERTTAAVLGSGSKRKGVPATERTSSNASVVIDDAKGCLVSELIQFSPTTDATLVRVGNPLLELQPQTQISIKRAGSAFGLIPRPFTTEEYAIVHYRDIAAENELALVFRGRHTTFGDTVVKVIRRKTPAPESAVPRLARYWRNEIEFFRRIDHPHIAKFYGADARFYAIYMEYVPHTNLAEAPWRDLRTHFFAGTLEDATCIIAHMASALNYLHNVKKTIHNDIKPANIVYDPTRGPVLIDFGLATDASSRPCYGGTSFYVPGELLLRERGPKSDVYSLAVSGLYFLKKMALPDATEEKWPLKDVHEHPRAMRGWLARVAAMRERLNATGLEAHVKNALIAVSDGRVSAHDLSKSVSCSRKHEAPVGVCEGGVPVSKNGVDETFGETSLSLGISDVLDSELWKTSPAKSNGIVASPTCFRGLSPGGPYSSRNDDDDDAQPLLVSVPSWEPWDPFDEAPWICNTGEVQVQPLNRGCEATKTCRKETTPALHSIPNSELRNITSGKENSQATLSEVDACQTSTKSSARQNSNATGKTLSNHALNPARSLDYSFHISVHSIDEDYRVLTCHNGNIYFDIAGYININHLRKWAKADEEAWKRGVTRANILVAEKKIVRGKQPQAGIYFASDAAKRVLQTVTDDCDLIDEIVNHVRHTRSSSHLVTGIANGRPVSRNASTKEWNLSEILLASHLDERQRNQLLSEIAKVVDLRTEQHNDNPIHWISFRHGVRVIRYLGIEEELNGLVINGNRRIPSDEMVLKSQGRTIVYTLSGDIQLDSVVNWIGCSERAVKAYLKQAGITRRTEYGLVKQGGRFVCLDDAKTIFSHYKYRVGALDKVENSLRNRLLQVLQN